MPDLAQLTDDCIACHRPFPVVGELASLPNAKRLAFDPELDRVWRICTHCGHWNLVGRDASAACVAELRARLTVPTQPAIQWDTIGAVDVLLVSSRPDAVTVARDGLNARRYLAHGPMVRWGFAAIGVAIFVGPMFFLEDIPIGKLETWQGLLPMVVGPMLGQVAFRVWMRGRLERWKAGVAVLGSLLLIFVVPRYSESNWLDARTTTIFLLFGALLSVLADLIPVWPRVQTIDGQKIRLSQRQLWQLTLGIDQATGRAAAFGLPNGQLIAGPGLNEVIGALGADDLGKTMPREIEAGWLLLRQHEGLDGVMAALDRLRPEANGRHRWTDLPTAWQAALQIGVVEANGTVKEKDALREKINAASEVAALADGLDG